MSNAYDILKGHDDFMRNMHKDREFKGTPGPWSVGSIAAQEVHARNIAGADGYHVAKVSSRTYEEVEANAHIIAAALELLEALVMAVEEYKKLPHSLGYDFTHLPKMEAAIAKTLGENNV